MNSGVKHKLLAHEVTPPPGVWEKIAAELDESELHHDFPSKIYEAEVIAPAGVWNKIAAELDGSPLHHSFPTKLYEAEIAAPAATWDNIAAALDAENEVASPKRKLIAPWIRYAAAAVVIGLVAWGGLNLINNNKKGDSKIASEELIHKTATNADIVATPQGPTNVINTQDINQDKTDEERNDAALEASKKTFAKLDMPVNSHKLKNIASSYSFASSIETEPIDNYVAERDPADLSDRYIVLMTPDGHFVRMAKKLSNMVCCVSGEEQDKDCVDQMSRWKEKMACSPTGHSTGSFLDILSLIKSLDDK